MSEIWPTEIRVSGDRKSLAITFDNDVTYDFSAEFLRVTSPSAEVQGHSPDQKKTLGGKKDVEIMDVQPVGNYAVRISFTDLHNSGYFTWSYFEKSGLDKDAIWNDYLQDLEAKGLKREL